MATSASTGRRASVRWPAAGLRARSAFSFALVAFVVAAALGATAFTYTRQQITEERTSAAVRQAYVNARLTRSVLRSPNPDVPVLIGSLGRSAGSTVIVRHRHEWYSSQLGVGADDVPSALAAVVEEGQSGHQRVRPRNGELSLAVGVPVPAVDAAFFELFSWAELESSLDALVRSLLLGTAVATAAGAVAGFTWAGRALRPVRPIADAAERIAAGHLDTRLDRGGDRDLRRLVDAFNGMATALEERLAREARFTADVTHEIRSPLTSMAAAVSVIERRQAQLPPEVQEVLDELGDTIRGFGTTVLDLLEIARVDAGTAHLDIELVDVRRLVERVLELHGETGAIVEARSDCPTHVYGDRRRLAQVFENLVVNAARYAGGVKRVSFVAVENRLRVLFDDQGPGVAPDETSAIFERFTRGRAGIGAGASSGTGLGLALSREHARLHEGDLWVEDAPGGGARFVLELPRGSEAGPS